MDASASASPDLDSVARRRSGRVVCAPAKFAPEANASKRKRGDPDDEDGETDDVLSDEELSNETEEGSDAEHPAPRSRSRKPPPAARSRKPSNKKPRINGSQPAAPGHVTRIPSRPKKTVRIVAGDEGTGLFADIFNSGDSPDAVAHKWLERYREDDAAALCDVVNCILQAAGCDLQVTVDDIRDPENIPIRLVELQSIYQEQHITDYPLVSKAKSMRSFREILVNFYHALIGLLHETDLLYKDPDLLDNIHAWLASMSSSSLRPFRHTATTIALAVQSGLVEVAGVLDRRIANIEHQAQATKKGKNKSKAAEIERSLDEANDYRKACNEFIQSFFDTVFVHRYRDVDPKIRTECVEALGSWIWHLPTVFMEPGYLRYLGWMLSDTHGPTRQEVLKQLSRVFKRDAQQLGHFIDRFRPRLIEMATLDADMSVRVAAISAIDTLRAAALLELSEIDAIGKLVFDTEPKIRKTVVNFFVACIDDVRQSKIEDIGGTNVLDELDVADEDDFESPRQEWINIKCLAETLAIYDAQIEETQQNRGLAVDIDFAADFVELSAPETRISLAAQVLYDKIPEVKMWELLAGYLLFDHTISTKSKSLSARNSTETAIFMKAVAPTGEEESILLDVLSSAIKSCLAPVGEHDRTKRRGHRVEAAEAQEETALELTTVIPKLLNKFGAVPETAAIVLRLEHSLKLSMFQQLRQDTSKYDKILDEISIQFNRHDDKRVLSEATSALLHARQHEELEELTDSKLSVLWENVINALRNFDTTCELSVRGNLAAAPLRELSTALMKISKLASISDCVDALEAIPGSGESRAPAIEMLSDVVHRGKYDPQEDDDEMDELEDEVVSFAIKACQFYFMWKTRALSQLLAASTSISDAEIDRFSLVRQRYRRHLIETFSSRVAIDELRLFATGSLCDLHLIFVTLRRLIKELGSQTGRASKLRALVQEIEPGLVPELLSIFDGAEKKYAKKAKKDKMLNEPAEDEDPMADDDEELDDDDNDMSKEQRYAAEFRAEKALCELTAKYVLVLSARIIDDRGAHARKLHRRMLRNKTKLGNNFKEVVAYLDEEVRPAARQAAKKAAGGPGSSNSQHANAGGLKTADARSQAAKVAANDDNGDDVENDGVEDVAADDEDLLFDDVPPEEGSREDLRRRELLDEENPVEDSSDETPKQMDTDLDDTVLGD